MTTCTHVLRWMSEVDCIGKHGFGAYRLATLENHGREYGMLYTQPDRYLAWILGILASWAGVGLGLTTFAFTIFTLALELSHTPWWFIGSLLA